MITVSFNAFLSLRPKLDRMGTPCPQSELSLADGTTVLDLTQGVGLDPDEVEAAFVNGRVLPKDTVLKDGDILNVDVTPVLPAVGGWHGDTNATFYIGQPSADARHVVEVARECLERGIAAVQPGAALGDIGWAIQHHAESNGCSVVREYTGHGIGRRFHSEPAVRHYGLPGTGLRLRRGMTFTIEPMINLGGHACRHLDDGWTVLTRDGSLSAQFEHTVVVTRRGCEVLTARGAPLRGSEDVPWARLGPLASYAG